MRSRVSIFIVVVSVLALVAATGAFASGDRSMGRKGAFSPAAERLDGGTLALDMNVPYERAELTLSGPGGVRVKRDFAGGEAITLRLVDKAGAPLANGSYRYSLQISPRPANSSAVKSGMFFVRDGTAVSRQTRRAELGQTREALNHTRFERSKQAREEQREMRKQPRPGREASGRPPVSERPDDPTFYAYTNFPYGVGIYDYYSYSPYLAFFVYNYYSNSYYYTGGIYSYAFPYSGYYYGSLSSYGEFWNNVYAGYGTWVSAPYNITNGLGNYDQVSGYFYYGYPLYGGFTAMQANGFDSGYNDYYSQNLVVMPFGVGVGTYFPTADLEVYDYNDYAALRLNNYYTTWAFSNTPGGTFTVNKIGSGGQEFSVRTRNNGDGVSTMKVQGTVEATGGFLNSSSRDVKTDFATLDSKEVLAKLAEVPVMSWRYKEDHQAARHAGPTAEDFQAAFQLGDGKTISTIDADGVALVAIQGLHSMLQEKEAALENLRAEKDQEIAELARRLAALEERLQAHLPGGS
jgi:hypothetical protein